MTSAPIPFPNSASRSPATVSPAPRPSPGAAIDRRAFLRALAVSPFVLTGVGVFDGAVRAQAAAAGLISANVCLLQPQVTEGPFYIDPKLIRSDITDGRPGVPLDLEMQVVAADCTPLARVRVDVWHCDALGNYSGFAAQGSDATSDASAQTFLRGTQITDATGLVGFRTIYPGWYRGRTVHIHYKVFTDGRNALTGQIFFPDALSEYLFRNVAPYDARGSARDTMNGRDVIAAEAGAGAYAAVREQPSAYRASLVVGIDPEVAPKVPAPAADAPPRGPAPIGADAPFVPGRG